VCVYIHTYIDAINKCDITTIYLFNIYLFVSTGYVSIQKFTYKIKTYTENYSQG